MSDEKKLRREKINMMLNEEERRIIKDKAIKYGFGDCLAEYIRSASIYENIYVEEVEGKNEIVLSLSECMSSIREIFKEQKKICFKPSIDEIDVLKIKTQNAEILDMLDSIKSLIVSTLFINVRKKFQDRLNIIDMYKVDGELLKRVTSSDNIFLRPSNLHVPVFKDGYLVFIRKFEFVFRLKNLMINDFENTLNRLRDIAIQKEAFLIFQNIENVLYINIAIPFQEKDKAIKFAQQINEPLVFEVKNKVIGESYSSDS